MNMNERCTVCGAVWDNRVQNHRRGIDCVDKLGADVQVVMENMERMKNALEETNKRLGAQSKVSESHLNQIEKILVGLNDLEKRLLALKK